jgi:FkbM family methyltransferase
VKVLDRAKVPFVLASTREGPMIVSRLDYTPGMGARGAGVGYEYLSSGEFDRGNIELLEKLAFDRRGTHGESLVIVDGGANIGAYSIALGKYIEPWDGVVLAFEPQEPIYYALCGNIALNNCFNIKASRSALAANGNVIGVPGLDYRKPATFGGLSLNPALHSLTEEFGQAPDWDNVDAVPVTVIDRLNLPRLDILKLDIEGMELDALAGARNTINKYKPIIFVETFIVGRQRLHDFFGDKYYEKEVSRLMSIFLHRDDPLNNEQWLKSAVAEAAAVVAAAAGAA